MSHARSRWTLVVVALALLLRDQPAPAKEARSSTAGLWVGSASSKQWADLGLATLALEAESDFWVVVDDDGNASGEAAVTYSLSFDDSAFRALAAEGNAVAGEVCAAGVDVGVPMPGAATLCSLLVEDKKQIVGVSVVFDDGYPVRKGKIKGRIDKGELSLAWVTSPEALRYSYSKELLKRTELITTKDAPAKGPWEDTPATLQEARPGDWVASALSVAPPAAKGDKGIIRRWTAHRVSR